MKSILSLALALGIIFVGSPSEARKGDAGCMRKVMQSLDLTADQKNKMKKIRQEFRGKIKPVRTQKQSLRKEMKNALANNASESEVNKLHSSLKDVRGKMSDLRFERMKAIQDVLTVEQKKKFSDLKWSKCKTKGNKPMDDEGDE